MSAVADKRSNASTAAPASTEPVWLDTEERSTWLSLLAMMMLLPSALDAQLQRDAGLTFFEYMVLALLAEQPERRMCMSELAAVTNGSPSRLSHVARRLEGQHFLERENDAVDGRYTNAVLTDAGLAKVVAAAPGHVATARSLVIDSLTRQQLRQLRTAADRILTRVSGDVPCAAG